MNLLEESIWPKKTNPSEGDYCQLIQEDFQQCNIIMDKNVIIAMGELEYKKHIKKTYQESSILSPDKNSGTTHKS